MMIISVCDETKMYRRNYLPLVSMLGLLILNATAMADKAPLSAKGLRNEADLVIVATIEKIRIETEASQFEGAGNWDWAIYLELKVTSVEKGDFEGDSLEAKCFRIKSRRSAYEYLTPTGHYPIPETGTRVKAFLARAGNSWDVILPNGLAPISADGNESSERLPEAEQVHQLRSLTYTYLLSIEGWLLVIAIGIPLLLYIRWFWRRNHPTALTEES